MEYYPAIRSKSGTKQRVFGEHMELPHATTITVHTTIIISGWNIHAWNGSASSKEAACHPSVFSISQRFPKQIGDAAMKMDIDFFEMCNALFSVSND